MKFSIHKIIYSASPIYVFSLKAYLILTAIMILPIFNLLNNFKPHMTAQNDELWDRIYFYLSIKAIKYDSAD